MSIFADISVSQIKSAGEHMSRFPFPIPLGWFHVAFDNEIKAGELRAVEAFGKPLVLWRADSGELVLQDRYCPHLGANFAVGGEVVGNAIKCPFHHWEFGTDGKVAAIPYAKRLNQKACVRTYPLQEKYGVIFAWNHPDGEEPFYNLPEIPELDDPDFVPPLVSKHEISTCLQEMGENVADGAHFETIHNHPGAASYDRFDCVGPEIFMESRQLFPSSGGPIEGTLNTQVVGFGMSVVRYQTLVEVCMLTTQTPVNDHLVHQYFHVSWKNPDRDDKIDRIGAAFHKEVNRQLTDDIPIWENKIYQPKPYLCDGDGPIAKFRNWSSQFYAGTEAA